MAVKKKLILTGLKGLDLSGSGEIDPLRSPDAPNMMPGPGGDPVKRPGARLTARYSRPIYGVYFLRHSSGTVRLVHAGSVLFNGSVPLCTDMAERPAAALQLGEHLYLADGKTFRRCSFDGTGVTVTPVEQLAAVPLIRRDKDPNTADSGVPEEPPNLLTGRRSEGFLPDGTTRKYLLCGGGLTGTAVTAALIRLDGSEQLLREGTEFTVNRGEGYVLFAAAPSAQLRQVRITYELNESRAELINSCTIGIVYGAKGEPNRIFLSGSPLMPAIDLCCRPNDPTRFWQKDQKQVGGSLAPITGYSLFQNRLITHKREEENDRCAFVRSLDEEFICEQVLQGPGAVNHRCCVSIGGEPCFLTREGVFTITQSDLNDRYYQLNRSRFISTALKGIADKNCLACRWRRFYVLAAEGSLYLMDSGQSGKDGSWECYHWPDINASALWVENDTLCWATAEGCLYELMPADNDPGHYRNPDGSPVVCRRSTPPLCPGKGYGKRTIRDIFVTGTPGSVGGSLQVKIGSALFPSPPFSPAEPGLLPRLHFRRPLWGTKPVALTLTHESAEPFGIHSIELHYTEEF